MMAFTVQDIAVTLVALAAAAGFVRRLIGPRRGRATAHCPQCSSGPGCAVSPVNAGAPQTHPLVLVRPKRP
jgi:hypothetical protein